MRPPAFVEVGLCGKTFHVLVAVNLKLPEYNVYIEKHNIPMCGSFLYQELSLCCTLNVMSLKFEELEFYSGNIKLNDALC